MNKEVVKELIQHEMNKEALIFELSTILPGKEKRELILNDYGLLKEKLDKGGFASAKAADSILQFLHH